MPMITAALGVAGQVPTPCSPLTEASRAGTVSGFALPGQHLIGRGIWEYDDARAATAFELLADAQEDSTVEAKAG
jgi:hypothetical protein